MASNTGITWDEPASPPEASEQPQGITWDAPPPAAAKGGPQSVSKSEPAAGITWDKPTAPAKPQSDITWDKPTSPGDGEIQGPIAGMVSRATEGATKINKALPEYESDMMGNPVHTPQPEQPEQPSRWRRALDVAQGAGEVMSAPFYPANYVGQEAGDWLTRHSGEMTDQALDAKIARAREIQARSGSAAGASAEVNELPTLERIRAMPYEERVKLSREAWGSGIEGGAQGALMAAGMENPGWLLGPLARGAARVLPEGALASKVATEAAGAGRAAAGARGAAANPTISELEGMTPEAAKALGWEKGAEGGWMRTGGEAAATRARAEAELTAKYKNDLANYDKANEIGAGEAGAEGHPELEGQVPHTAKMPQPPSAADIEARATELAGEVKAAAGKPKFRAQTTPEGQTLVRDAAGELRPVEEHAGESLSQNVESQTKAAAEGGAAPKAGGSDYATTKVEWPKNPSWLRQQIDKIREGLPANLPLLKERPDSPVISIIRQHQADRTQRAIEMIDQPWAKSLLHSGESAEEFGPKFVEWEANGFKGAPREIQDAVEYLKAQRQEEKAARLYLGDQELRDVPGSYWPRIMQKDLDAIKVKSPLRGGAVSDVRTTLGAFEKSREWPTMKQGMVIGKEKYIDPRRALLIRANTGHDVIETAGMLQDLEKAGVVSRGTNSFGKAGVELFEMPTGGSWWARGPVEARVIRDELTSVSQSSLARVSSFLNQWVRNPSLVNPAVHELKNMTFKFALSGGNPRKFALYENEFRRAQGGFPYSWVPGAKQIPKKFPVSPETRQLVDQFLEVMPESRYGTSASEAFGHAEFALEHPTAAKVGNVVRAPQEASHGYLFGTADPSIKYARWRQYVDKGMDAQTAANHVRIDLIDYGMRSGLIDFWRSVPGNFFVTWRTGTVQSLIKQGLYHPYRTALLFGGFEYLREMAYEQTGYWLHTPVDYVEQPIARVVADAYKNGPISWRVGGDIGSIIGTTALLGPGGNVHSLENMFKVLTNPADRKNLKKVFWGLAQIFDATDAIPGITQAIDSGDTGKLAGYFQTFMAVAPFGAYKVDKAHRPPALGQLAPKDWPGMKYGPGLGDAASAVKDAFAPAAQPGSTSPRRDTSGLPDLVPGKTAPDLTPGAPARPDVVAAGRSIMGQRYVSPQTLKSWLDAGKINQAEYQALQPKPNGEPPVVWERGPDGRPRIKQP